MKQQQRFIIALVASAAVLILWNYLFPPVKPPQPGANANANTQAAQASPQSTSQPAASATPTPAPAAQSQSPTPDNVPHPKIRVLTPLYDATFDTRGAVATSWIIKKNKNTGREIYSANSTRTNPKPL